MPGLTLNGGLGRAPPWRYGCGVATNPTPAMTDGSAETKVRVWDLPTRLFHWLLAAAVVGSVVSAKIGGAAMAWHFRFGYLVLLLVAFRILWGLVGGRWSRFASFVYAPGTLLRYLRGQARPGEHLEVGHSPLGALSVFALLGFLALQLATGLVADDEIANIGPLNRFVSSESALQATGWHTVWGQYILIALVVLHVLAIAYYALGKKMNLVRPMLVGDKRLPPGTPASADGWPQRVLALAVLLICFAAVAWVWKQGA
jgi:cytochrome b